MVDGAAGSGDVLLVERSAGFWFACPTRPGKRNALSEGLVGARGDRLAGVAALHERRAPPWQGPVPELPRFR